MSTTAVCNQMKITAEKKSKDITYIVPWSEELKDPSAFEKQQAILDKKAGILALEEDTEG